jgi:dUTP pyrophosphatase
MNFYKLHPDAATPGYATEGSGCFDLSACLLPKQEVVFWDQRNEKKSTFVTADRKLLIPVGCRMLVPTGLIFDIPDGYRMDITARSSTPLKLGLFLPNSVGKIDSDYVNETYLMLGNITAIGIVISHGDRLCQAELQKVIQCEFAEVFEAPAKKTSRNGGMGSTGR